MENPIVKKIATACFLVVVALGVFTFFNSADCESYHESELKPIYFNGKVVKKYRDKNHAYPTIEITMNNELIQLPIGVSDKSGLFSSVKVGDSLLKKAGSYEIHVWSESYNYQENKKFVDHNVYKVTCE